MKRQIKRGMKRQYLWLAIFTIRCRSQFVMGKQQKRYLFSVVQGSMLLIRCGEKLRHRCCVSCVQIKLVFTFSWGFGASDFKMKNMHKFFIDAQWISLVWASGMCLLPWQLKYLNSYWLTEASGAHPHSICISVILWFRTTVGSSVNTTCVSHR